MRGRRESAGTRRIRYFKPSTALKSRTPATDCICPIGEELILKGLHEVVPGRVLHTPPRVRRPSIAAIRFQIEVGLAFGGGPTSHKITRPALVELLEETDARTLRQFLMNTFDGLGADGADKILKQAKSRTRVSPGKLTVKELDALHEAMQSINLSEGQSMNVLRYANRVPLQFQGGACAITQTVMGMNWRSYGLGQSRGQLPRGPITLMVHIASVWVPFTSESKEAIASYPEIQKEIRLGLQAVGRKLGMFMRRRKRVKHEGERRGIFLRYLGEVAEAVSTINGCSKDTLYENLLEIAKKKTAEADAQFDDRGRRIDPNDFGDNVIIVDPNAKVEEEDVEGEEQVEEPEES